MVSAASPYHAVGSANGTFLGVLRTTPASSGRSPRPPTALAALVAGSAAVLEEELERKAQAWRLTLARTTGADGEDEPAARRPPGPGRRGRRVDPAEPAGTEVVLSDDDEALAAATGSLRRARTPWRSRCSASSAAARRSAPCTCGACSGRARFTPEAAADVRERLAACDEDQLLLDSAVKSRRRLLHHPLRQPVLEVHRALGSAPRPHAQPGHDRVDGDGSAGSGRLRDRRALGPRRRSRDAADRVHDRLRRRPARALHAPVLEVRRVAGLGVRSLEGVPRVRRPGDRREPRRRPGVAARVLRDHAPDLRHMSRLLLRRDAARPARDRAAAAARPGPRQHSAAAARAARPSRRRPGRAGDRTLARRLRAAGARSTACARCAGSSA